MVHKKQWKQPELIVLVRGKPEEAVLTACKGNGDTIAPYTNEIDCVDDNCGNCSTRAAS
jgi:hypothetical protein